MEKSEEKQDIPVKKYTKDEVKQLAWYAVQHSAKLEAKGKNVVCRKDIDDYLDEEMSDF